MGHAGPTRFWMIPVCVFWMIPVCVAVSSECRKIFRGDAIMKFVLACNGTRGDCEPSLAVGRELRRRGHDVCMGTPPNLIHVAESVGLPAVPYGPDALDLWDPDFQRDFTRDLLRRSWTVHGPIELVRELFAPVLKYWAEMSAELTELADGADLLCTGLVFQDLCANVAEYYDIPLVALHYFPVRDNGQVYTTLPAPLARSVMGVYDWFCRVMSRKVEDEQRRSLGLPRARKPGPQRAVEHGSLEIQAYDDILFPGLAAEWSKRCDSRPFVGALTMDLATDADEDVEAWIDAGTPPICFAFGSRSVGSPEAMIEMLADACDQLGERALVCSGWTDYSNAPQFDHVKVVGLVSYSATFPACHAVVHHGGSGTTAAALRAGVPALILWTVGDQPFWGAQLKRLKVGAARRFSSTTTESLVADLRRILVPEYAARAREFAGFMTKPSESISNAANLIEEFARSR